MSARQRIAVIAGMLLLALLVPTPALADAAVGPVILVFGIAFIVVVGLAIAGAIVALIAIVRLYRRRHNASQDTNRHSTPVPPDK